MKWVQAAALAITMAMPPVATAQTYAVLEQDTHGMTLVEVESVSSPTPTTRQFTIVGVNAWPELWQDSYAQMSRGLGEIDCWNHILRWPAGTSSRMNIQGDEISVSVGDGVEYPISTGYEAYEKYFCDQEVTVSVAPFRSLEDAKRYYFSWLNRNVPRVYAD